MPAGLGWAAQDYERDLSQLTDERNVVTEELIATEAKLAAAKVRGVRGKGEVRGRSPGQRGSGLAPPPQKCSALLLLLLAGHAVTQLSLPCPALPLCLAPM